MLCKTEREGAEFIRKIAEYELISGVVWIIIAILQVCSCYCVIAGVWNIFVAVSRFKSIARIKARDPKIPEEYESLSPLIIVGVVNLLLGGVIGVACVVFDYIIRGMALENRHVFNGSVLPDAEPDKASAQESMAGLLTRLAKLHNQGALTKAEFDFMKQDLLDRFQR